MPVDIPANLAAEQDRQHSSLAVATFLTMRHPRMSEPAMIVSSPFGGNVGNHVLAGQLYGGIPFKFVDPSDDEREPRGTFEIFNYQNKIGHLIESLKTRALLTFETYVARDFAKEFTGEPPARQPLGTPRLLSRYTWLTLVNIEIGTWVTGDLVPYGKDLSRERASPLRAVVELFPGLFP